MRTDIVVGVVEDEPVQAELYAAMLAAGGVRATVYGSVAEFRRQLGAESIDVLLLDWNLPGVSGIELLKSLREQVAAPLPIILLTANSDERDVVYALQSGADDYVVKPPRPAELVARIRAAHRRTHPNAQGRELSGTEPFRFDLRERVVWLNGERLTLTEREYDLLAYLFRRPDRIVSRQMLLTDVWNVGAHVNTRSVDTYISRLRKQLGLNGENGWVLEGIYHHGYRLARKAA